ncbi:MAG TPA: HdeD family acid-resistance protein [Chloroflexota bacterium]|nr:HdeD family acid-resistance protein [Chloroflexota bacterium]
MRKDEGMLLVDELARHWWLVALRGLLAVVFGLLAFAWPGMTLVVLIVLFGAYAVVDGVLGILAALRGDTDHRLAMLLEGVVSVVAGVVAFVWPGLTALVLAYIIAFWAILTGVLEIVAAVRLRRVIHNEWALLVGGALSVLFGVVVAAAPGAGALALVWLIGAYAVVFGIALIAVSWRLRSHAQRLGGAAPTRRPAIS